MTGERFWYQTAYCHATLCAWTGCSIPLNLLNDGSLTTGQVDQLKRLFPVPEILNRDDFPYPQHPTIKARREVYPNLCKLTDIHGGQRGWKLVLDSDMLFFARPEQLLRWLDSPDHPIHMIDCEESYGYSRGLLRSLAGAEIRPSVNVGIFGLRSEEVSIDELESWCRIQLEREGTSYFQEQALIAMLISRDPEAIALDRETYIVNPPAQASGASADILHHYVSESKVRYFKSAWRHADRKIRETVARQSVSTSP
jgi:hypothetical protein